MNLLCLLACLFVLAVSTSCSYLKGKPPEAVFRCVVKDFPTPGTSVMVWAIEQQSSYVGPEDRRAEHEATMWLREHGLSVVKRSQVEQVFSEQHLSMESGDAASLLQVGKLTGAKQVVLLQAYSDRVMVRAVDIETGSIVWSGTGEYVDASSDFKARASAPSLTRKTLEFVL